MDDRELRHWLHRVRDGAVSRRQFTRMMIGAGLTAPLAARCWPRPAWPRRSRSPAFTPTRAGRRRAPPHRCGGRRPPCSTRTSPTGTKRRRAPASSTSRSPPSTPTGNLVPILAAELPSVQNGGVAKDGTVGHLAAQEERAVARRQALHRRRRRLQLGVRRRPRDRRRDRGHRTARSARGSTRSTATRSRLVFKPSPALLGRRLLRQPRHDPPQARLRARSRAPSRARRPPTSSRSEPGRTGSWTSSPATSIRAELNPDYHVPNRPFFDTARDEGRRRRRVGGARRAADRRVRLRLEHAGRGRHPASAWSRAARAASTSAVDRRRRAHPAELHRSVDARSTASARAPRPRTRSSPTPPSARRSTSSSTARRSRSRSTAARARPRPNFLNAPPLPLAEHALGVQRRQGQPDPRGRGLEAGRRRRPRQGRQAAQDRSTRPRPTRPRRRRRPIVKQAAAKAGHRDRAEVRRGLRLLLARIPPTPTPTPHFFADLQMYTTTLTPPDPQCFMDQFVSWEVAGKENKWQGRNITRWRNEEYDRLWTRGRRRDGSRQARRPVHPDERPRGAASVVIPLVHRNWVAAASNQIRGVELSGWDSTFWRPPLLAPGGVGPRARRRRPPSHRLGPRGAERWLPPRRGSRGGCLTALPSRGRERYDSASAATRAPLSHDGGETDA